jgi:uncharacterized protein (UPF0147 family)
MKRLSPSAIKKKNDEMTDNIDKNMKVIKEIKQDKRVPIKVKSMGATFSSLPLEDK